jgi:integrase
LEVLDSYVRYCERRGFSTATIENYTLIVTLWDAHLHKLGVGTPGIAEVESFLERPGLSPATQLCYGSWLSSFCKWAVSEGIYTEDPTAKMVRPYVSERIPRVISEKDLEKALRDAESPRMRLWLLLAAKAGLRCKEIAGVRGDDINLEDRRLIVSNPKGRRQRVVPLNAELVAAFEAYGVGDGYLFPGTKGACHVTPNTVSMYVGKYLRDHGIDASAHSLRHRYASRLYALTKDLRYVQDRLGHADPATTVRYTHLDADLHGGLLDQL